MAPAGRNSVFVGNIPFNLSEEQIIAILSQAGQVVKFRLMTNPDTGKPKGFGFADYVDADSAASAVRNLNDHEVQGRKIRVDWPHNNEKDSVPTNYDQANPPPIAPDGLGGAALSNALPPLPPGVDVPPNLSASDAISRTISTIPTHQLLDVLTQMKALAISEPAKATELLRQAPQLSYAIFQALINMNLVDPTVLASVVEQTAQPTHQQLPQAAPPVPQPTPQQQYSGYPQPSIPTPQFQQPRPAMPGPTQGYAPPPPISVQQPPPQQQQQQQQSMSQEEMLRQVMQMDQRTIDTLPPMERAQIMQLRAQMMSIR